MEWLKLLSVLSTSVDLILPVVGTSAILAPWVPTIIEKNNKLKPVVSLLDFMAMNFKRARNRELS
jgi:hypothetical protein